jgi:hypothetical protein
MQSVPIASKVLRSIPARGEVCSIQTSTTLRCTRYKVRQGWAVHDTNFYNVEVHSIQSSPGMMCARYKLLQRWGVLDTLFARGKVCPMQTSTTLRCTRYKVRQGWGVLDTRESLLTHKFAAGMGRLFQFSNIWLCRKLSTSLYLNGWRFLRIIFLQAHTALYCYDIFFHMYDHWGKFLFR